MARHPTAASTTNITAGARGAHATRLAWSSVAPGRPRRAARLTERL